MKFLLVYPEGYDPHIAQEAMAQLDEHDRATAFARLINESDFFPITGMIPPLNRWSTVVEVTSDNGGLQHHE